MIKQKEKKNWEDWVGIFAVIIIFSTALYIGTWDVFNLKNYFIEYFSYSFVSCPCNNSLTRFLEYPVAYFFLTLIYLIIIFLPIYLLSVLLKKLIKKFEDKSKNYEFRLFIFTISIYETILLILYFTTEIFEERTSLFFVLFLVIPFFYFIFLKIFKNWVK